MPRGDFSESFNGNAGYTLNGDADYRRDEADTGEPLSHAAEQVAFSSVFPSDDAGLLSDATASSDAFRATDRYQTGYHDAFPPDEFASLSDQNLTDATAVANWMDGMGEAAMGNPEAAVKILNGVNEACAEWAAAVERAFAT